MKAINCPISQKEIKTIVEKLKEEGLSDNEFDSVFTQYILERCGIDPSCPTIIHEPYPNIIRHRVNMVDKEKRFKNIEYWSNRFSKFL